MSEQNPETVPSAPESEPAPRWHGVHREAPSGPRLWARARQAFFALPRGLHVVMLAVFMILGFALATQVRAQRSDPLEGLSEQDLVTVLDELSTQEQNLRTRRGELSSELDDLRSAADEAQAREQAARKAETQAQIAAGTVPVHGPGVTVSVVDAGANLASTQFVMTLGELRNAGAEAIELNGIRLSTRSSFTGPAGSIAVDGADARQGRQCGDHAVDGHHDRVDCDSASAPVRHLPVNSHRIIGGGVTVPALVGW